MGEREVPIGSLGTMSPKNEAKIALSYCRLQNLTFSCRKFEDLIGESAELAYSFNLNGYRLHG